MPESPAESDLFQESTMTFGQHLEELRTCLFRAIIGLAIGCCAGFCLWATRSSTSSRRPVENALNDYYEKQADDKAFRRSNRNCSQRPATRARPTSSGSRTIVAKQHVSFDVVSVDPREVLSNQLPSRRPAGAAPDPPASAGERGDPGPEEDRALPARSPTIRGST